MNIRGSTCVLSVDGISLQGCTLAMLRYAIRVLCKTPILTSVIIATIALGVGANTTIFTIVYATQIAPLPFPEPRQLVSVWSIVNSHKDNPTPKDFLMWRDHVSSFQGLSAFAGNGFNVGEPGQTENIFGMRVGRDYYHTLGTSFFLGRDFRPEESLSGQNHVVILTHALWKHFGADTHSRYSWQHVFDVCWAFSPTDLAGVPASLGMRDNLDRARWS